MKDEYFNEQVKQMKRMHLIGSITLTIATIAFFLAPISAYYSQAPMPYGIKSLLMLFTIGNIPLMYWLYNKNVIETEQSDEDRKTNFVKWTYARMGIWAINVLLCLLVYHFDSDAIAHKVCTTFYLTLFCLAFFVFMARVTEKDAENKDKD